ncbi:hypothetical protein NOVO_05465 [Rickettsiales bacterium Ac37b]|nr:hypothetical protein NOVO_05465 [Rickettsiales bacterium Ac37b]
MVSLYQVFLYFNNKIRENCFFLEKNTFWIEQQDSKIGGFIKLLDHTLVRCEQINNNIKIYLLELTENYNILRRNFFRVTALYNHTASERQYKYVSLLLAKLTSELENIIGKHDEFLKEQLLIIELKINTDRENLMKGNSYE